MFKTNFYSLQILPLMDIKQKVLESFIDLVAIDLKYRR